VLTAWLQIDEEGFELRGLGRPTVKAVWSEVGQVIAVRDIERGSSATEMLDAPASAYDGVYVLDPRGQRLLAVSSRFFGLRAQERTLEMARQAGVRIEHIEAIGTAELRAQVPQALSFGDRHPNLTLLLLAAFYIFHNVLTFAVWGLCRDALPGGASVGRDRRCRSVRAWTRCAGWSRPPHRPGPRRRRCANASRPWPIGRPRPCSSASPAGRSWRATGRPGALMTSSAPAISSGSTGSCARRRCRRSRCRSCIATITCWCWTNRMTWPPCRAVRMCSPVPW